MVLLYIGSINFPARAEKHIYSSQSAALVTFKLLSVPDGCEGSDGLFLHSWQLAFPVRGKLGHDDGTHVWTRARSATRPTARRRPDSGQTRSAKVSAVLQGQPSPRGSPVCRTPECRAKLPTPRHVVFGRSICLLVFRHFLSRPPNNPSIHPSKQATNHLATR